MRAQIFRALSLLAVAIVGVVGGWHWLRGPVVSTHRLARGDAAEVVYASGIVEPRVWAKVSSLQRKKIVELCKCEGRAVKQGEVLGRLDDTEEKAMLAELLARRDRLMQDVERLKALTDRNVSSRVTYDDKQTQLREYEAKVAAQRDRIADLELRAPMDGVVLRQDGEVGEIVGTAATDVLFWVGQPQPLRITAEVNEEDISRVRTGQVVWLRHEGFAGSPLTATVDEITPKGDPANKTFRVYFALPESTPLKIGMSIEANIVVREVKGALLAPAEALKDGKIAVIADGRVRDAVPKTGIKSTRFVEIVSGLEEGQFVISPSRADLKPGARVRMPAGAAP